MLITGKRLEAWMLERGYTDDQILIDDDGTAYIEVEDESGTPGEDGYNVKFRKIKIPDHLQEQVQII